MKIGLLLNFLDFRNDIRRVINLLSDNNQIVIFLNNQTDEYQNFLKKENIEIREVHEKKYSFLNKFVGFLFSRFGKIPKSKNNYYILERYLISLEENKYKRIIEYLKFDFFYRFPKFISYDYYLSLLDYAGNTKIDDIDKFIIFTRVSNDFLLARLIKEKKRINTYVYSWDHPAKHKEFSKKLNYLVWSNEIKKDLSFLQQIPYSKIKSIGSSQLCYLEEYLKNYQSSSNKPYNFNYIYFACMAGIGELVEQEIDIILKINNLIIDSGSKFKLVVRPYPVLKDWNFYEKLYQEKSILVEKDYRSQIGLAVSEEKIFDKLNKINHASAFLHLGTTLGLEACFFDTPSILINFGYRRDKSKKNISNAIHQYQNIKYLMIEKKSIISSEAEFLKFLSNLSDPESKQINKNTVELFNIKSFEKLAKNLISY